MGHSKSIFIANCLFADVITNCGVRGRVGNEALVDMNEN